MQLQPKELIIKKSIYDRTLTFWLPEMFPRSVYRSPKDRIEGLRAAHHFDQSISLAIVKKSYCRWFSSYYPIESQWVLVSPRNKTLPVCPNVLKHGSVAKEKYKQRRILSSTSKTQNYTTSSCEYFSFCFPPHLLHAVLQATTPYCARSRFRCRWHVSFYVPHHCKKVVQ